MKTLIIDGNNTIHRTYWTAKNQVQRMKSDDPDLLRNFHIHFTLNAIFSYVCKYKPTRTICVWDEKPDYMQNDRKAQFGEYKGNRSTDSSPHNNNETIKRFLSHLNVLSMFPRQLEADDIVAFLCHELEGKKVIVSVDKDFLQLVNKDVSIFNPIKKEEYDYLNFAEVTGLPDTKTWLDIKCLTGDKSDNVPGIEKFGKVKVQKWLNGEITLNEQEQEIADRNRSLFSLDLYKTYPDEKAYYETQLQVEQSSSWKEFLNECNNLQLNQILNKKDSWHSAFFLQNKLQSLFA